MVKFMAILAIFCQLATAHGILYEVREGKAVIISAYFGANIPAAYSELIIYQGDSAIPLLTTRMDSHGRFAFLPPEKGTYRVQLTASSDHGEHKQEFSLDTNDILELTSYQAPVYHQYIGILSAVGIIFGLFGMIALIKSRQK